MVYLDHAAGTPLSEKAFNAMLPYLRDNYANPGGMYRAAYEAKNAVEQARNRVAAMFGTDASEVCFTGGGTESNCLAVLGSVRALARTAAERCARGSFSKSWRKYRVITSQIEHPAVLNSFRQLEKEGFEVVYLAVDKDGIVHPDVLKESLSFNTLFVSVMTANNETGVIQPICSLARIAHDAGAVFHTDAVAAAGSIRINLNDFGADLVSISGHKIYGPKGVGALLVRKGTEIEAIQPGGGQENGLRSGTPNVPGIVGLGVACEETATLLNTDNGMPEYLTRTRKLRDRLFKGIKENIPEAVVNGAMDSRLAGNLNISLRGADSSALLTMLDSAGICASGGSACSQLSGQRSHVLKAMGKSQAEINGALRFTLGRHTTESDIDACVAKLSDIAAELRNNGVLR